MADYILTIGASSSHDSINKKLVNYIANLINDYQVSSIDLNSFEMPIYSVDRETAEGIPSEAAKFKELINQSAGIVISLAEHNGSYTAAFKNIMDWASRLEGQLWGGKPMLLLSTAPGARGGATVLAAASQYFPYMGAEIVGALSIPKFQENFSPSEGLINTALKAELLEKVEALQKSIGR
jgi:NAD(P)H-dependent FMN reductase